MAKEKTNIPDAVRLRDMALSLVESQSTMTLATAHEKGPWAAPVYYSFVKSCFYFFSDPDSRHIQEAFSSGRASAAIFSPADTWQGIRGLQMSGAIENVLPGLRAVEAIRSYLRKFSFTKDFFDPSQSIDLSAFTKRFRVKLYRFRPQSVYYMDNQVRFGFREQITL